MQFSFSFNIILPLLFGSSLMLELPIFTAVFFCLWTQCSRSSMGIQSIRLYSFYAEHRPNLLVVAFFDSISLYYTYIFTYSLRARIIWFVSTERNKKKQNKNSAQQTRKLEIITKTPSKHCQITCNFSSFFCYFVVFHSVPFNYACIECDATTVLLLHKNECLP